MIDPSHKTVEYRETIVTSLAILASFTITQPMRSYHMKLFSSSGLVSSARKGKWTHYSLDKEEMDDLLVYLKLLSTIRSVTLVKSGEQS